ncbi:MAG: trypsin-like peptidase domain-containing protein [Lentisphaeria bacterium]|nr:trypsin-like peptidase domain-containing protein [Lentisphaeria bacterium]
MIRQKFFYFKSGNRIFGPMSAAQIRQKYRSGQLLDSDMISPDKEHWQSAGTFFNPPQNLPAVPTPAVEEVRPPLNPLSAGYPPQTVPLADNLLQPAEIIRKRASWGKFTGVFLLLAVFTVIAVTVIALVQKESAPGENAGGGASAVPDAPNAPTAPTAPAGNRSWSDIIGIKRQAVGVIVVEVTVAGQTQLIPCGTAWAMDENNFATNAHVAAGFLDISRYLRQNNVPVQQIDVTVIMNESNKRYFIDGIKIHPDYRGFQNGVPDSDFAVMHTSAKLPVYLTMASEAELKNIQQGNNIACIGFPMEGLSRQNINLASPTATMHDGIISALSDPSLRNSGRDKNTMIRHNLPTVGGASGSPIFASSGKVIAILNAGNMSFEFDTRGRYTGRKPSAAQVNFACRIDRIKPCLQAENIDIDDFLRK